MMSVFLCSPLLSLIDICTPPPPPSVNTEFGGKKSIFRDDDGLWRIVMWVYVCALACSVCTFYTVRERWCIQVYICVYILHCGSNYTSLAARKHINLSNTNSERRSGEDRESVSLWVCVCLREEEEEGVNERYTPPPELRRQKKKVWLS